MADPLTIVGGVASILQIINSVTKLSKGLNEVRESYNSVSLNITLVASQLSTIRAALEALHTWRSNDTVETEASKQLDQDLGLSLSCCAILITVIDGKLNESGYKPGWGAKQKIKYLWLEDILKEYISNLEGQVRALQLLLTIFQCRTATEQKQQLAKAESRSIIQQVKAETMTLGIEETEIDDAISILSHDPSVHFDMDSELMKSPAYVRVYGDREPVRKKKSSGPPPPPPPRRKPAPKLALPSIEAQSQAPPTSTDAKALPQAPPLVPPRPKPRDSPRQPQLHRQSQGQSASRGRINVWDFLGPDQENKDVGDAHVVMADSAPVFELPATPEPVKARQSEDVDPEKLETVIVPPESPAQGELIRQQFEQDNLPESDVIRSTATTVEEDTKALGTKSLDGLGSSPFGDFRIQLDSLLEVRKPPDLGEEGFRPSLGPKRASDAVSTSVQDETEPSQKSESLYPAGQKGQDTVNNTLSGTFEQKKDPARHGSDTPSIRSSVDLYDASVRNLPIDEKSQASSPRSLQEYEKKEDTNQNPVDDALEAGMEGLSILNLQLAAKYSDTQSKDTSTPPSSRLEEIHENGISECSEQPIHDKPRLATTFSGGPTLGPQIVMTPIKDDRENHPVDSSPPLGQGTQTLASPTRAPPVPLIPAIPIPIIPSYNAPVREAAERGSVVETSTASSRRNSSVFEVSSTMSSSEPSVDNTSSTLQKSTSNTIATSISINGPNAARDQAQADLRRLRSELATAKARGDSKAAQQSLQKSIEVIRRTYLASPASSEARVSPGFRDRKSFSRRFPSFTNSANSSALNEAAAAGDLLKLGSLLDSKVNVDARSKAYMTPLMLAAMNGHIQCLQILRQRGADESAVDSKGRNVLHLAVASGQVSAVKWLLATYPPNRTQQLKHRSSILFKATDSIMTRSPKDLRESSDAEGSKPLHLAAEAVDIETLNTLLSNGVNAESKNNWNRTPLHQAIIANRRACFDTLLRAGADISVRDAKSMTPLHWAAKTGHVDMIKTLLAKGANRKDHDNDGNQPIHQAAWVGKILGIEALMTERKSLDTRTKAGESMLHIACLTKNTELATYLLKNAVEVNAWATPQAVLLDNLNKFKVPLTSLTPLQYACCKGDFEMTALLLDHEAWINAATPEGVTPLMMAAESEDTNTINLLLSRGAKINASMPGTLSTVLHIASRRGDLETVQQLCRAGADRQARTGGSNGSYGRTPAEEAGAKCTDKAKRAAVEEYFYTIRQNVFRNARVRALESRQTHEMVGNGYMMPSPSLNLRPVAQPVSYAPWGQGQGNHSVTVPVQYVVPPQWAATYPGYPQQQPQMQMAQQWYDPDPMAQVGESPPPYVAGSSVSASLAAQAPVHRPGDETGPKYV